MKKESTPYPTVRDFAGLPLAVPNVMKFNRLSHCFFEYVVESALDDEAARLRCGYTLAEFVESCDWLWRSHTKLIEHEQWAFCSARAGLNTLLWDALTADENSNMLRECFVHFATILLRAAEVAHAKVCGYEWPCQDAPL